MDYASLLNEQQFAAVKTTAQHVRIIAGAGSGKTRVLTYRISYLISNMGVDPSKILAIAFTNKVASEMKERACKLVPDSSFFLHVSTFHSFCARFLRAESKAINYPIGFTIFDEDDQTALVKNIAVDFGYKKGDKIVKTRPRLYSAEEVPGRIPGRHRD
jgi:DNA helicase-2/ATP-dependent DNA helicase PcrA